MYCPESRYMLKVDDSTMIIPTNLLRTLGRSPGNNLAAGKLVVDSKPIRDQRYSSYVPKSSWSGEIYPPYLQSPSYLLSRDIVSKLLTAYTEAPDFPVEDVLLGIHLNRLRITPVDYADMDIHGLKRQYCHLITTSLSGNYLPGDLLFTWNRIMTAKDLPCVNTTNEERALLDGMLITDPHSNVCFNSDDVNEQTGEVFLLILVNTLDDDGKWRRQTIRDTYGKVKRVDDKTVVTLFVSQSDSAQRMYDSGIINSEDELVVLGKYDGSKVRRTVGLLWSKYYCPTASYVMVVDDDVIVNVRNTVRYLSSVTSNSFAMIGSDMKNEKSRFNGTFILSGQLINKFVFPAVNISSYCGNTAFIEKAIRSTNVRTVIHDDIDNGGRVRHLCDLDKLIASSGFYDNMAQYLSGLRLWLDYLECGNSFNNLTNRNFEYLLQHEDMCKRFGENTRSLTVLIGILSSPGHFIQRLAIRQTWGKISSRNDNTFIKRVFLLGRSNSESIQNKIISENSKYRDIIQQDFVEHYRNLTYKTIMLLEWASNYCSSADYVIKIDDDVFLNTDNMIRFLALSPRKLFYFGDTRIDTQPIRDHHSKWFTPEEAWPAELYPPYNNGPAYVMSIDVVNAVYRESKHYRVFPWEDVYIGNITNDLGVGSFPHHGFDNSNNVFRDACSLSVGLTSHSFTPTMLYKFWSEMKSCEKSPQTCCYRQPEFMRRAPSLSQSRYAVQHFDPLKHLPQLCNHSNDEHNIHLLILVASSCQKYDMRRYARLTWANVDSIKGRRVATFFVVGSPCSSSSMETFIKNEIFMHRDIIQVNVKDKTSKQYLNFKMLLSLQMMSHFCACASHVMIVNDDVFVNVPDLLTFLAKHGDNDLNLKGGRFCYDENCTCSRGNRDVNYLRRLKSSISDEEDDETLESGQKGTIQISKVDSTIILLSNKTVASVSENLRKYSGKITNIQIERIVEKIGKTIDVHTGFDVKGNTAAVEARGGSSCWLHRTLASASFQYAPNMGMVARNMHNGEHFRCDRNEYNPDNVTAYDCDRQIYVRSDGKTTTLHLRQNKHSESKNPRASFFINHPEVCQFSNGKRKDVFLLIMVTTLSYEEEYRTATRVTWASTSKKSNNNVEVLFFLGVPANTADQIAILREDSLNGDIIQGNFIDNFHNQTTKTLALIEWVSTFCAGARYVLKTRSDMFVNVRKLVEYLSLPYRNLQNGLALGRLLVHMTPVRNEKHLFYTSYDTYPNTTFPPYLGATSYIMSRDVVQKVDQMSRKSAMFPWEDVFMGMMLTKTGITMRDHSYFAGGSILDDLSTCETQLYFSWRMKTPFSIYAYHLQIMNADLDDCPSEQRITEQDLTFIQLPDKKVVNCDNDVIFLVISEGSSFSRRRAIRETWGQYYEKVESRNMATVFLLGKKNSRDVEMEVKAESRDFGDILQGDFIETYRNLVLKTIMGLKWINEYCLGVNYVVKIDDDVYANVKLLMTSLEQIDRVNIYRGFTYRGMMPLRDSSNKNSVSKEVWPDRPFPPYNAGPMYVLSKDVANRVYKAAFDAPLLANEDVFIGTVIQNIGLLPQSETRIDISGDQHSACQLNGLVARHHASSDEMYRFWYQQNKNILCDSHQKFTKFETFKPKSYVDTTIVRYVDDSHVAQNCSPETIILIITRSAPNNFRVRTLIRKVVAQTTVLRAIRVIFFVTKSASVSAQVNDDVTQESSQHGDIVFVDLVDNIEHSTQILVSELQWSSAFCKNMQYVLYSDDSIFVNYLAIFEYLRASNRSNLASGYVQSNIVPDREPSSDVYTPVDLYPDNAFPVFIQGPPYLFSFDVVKKLSHTTKSTPIFIWPQVYVGQLLEQLGIEPEHNPGFDVTGQIRTTHKCSLSSLLTSNFFTTRQLEIAWKGIAQCKQL
ncbi:uncharacterized protein LOC102806376 [Saccoglossus kowalevskii]